MIKHRRSPFCKLVGRTVGVSSVSPRDRVYNVRCKFGSHERHNGWRRTNSNTHMGLHLGET